MFEKQVLDSAACYADEVSGAVGVMFAVWIDLMRFVSSRCEA